MANVVIEIEASLSGNDWFRVFLYRSTDVGYETTPLGIRRWWNGALRTQFASDSSSHARDIPAKPTA